MRHLNYGGSTARLHWLEKGTYELGVPAYQTMEAISLPQPRRGTSNGTLAWRDADGGPADEHKRPQVLREQRSSARVREGVRSAGVRQGEKQECQRVSSKTPHPQEREARDRVHPPKFPLC
jgi:hypothetical protein